MSENKTSKMKYFTAGILKENPVIGLMLGICSTLAITTSITNGLGMGLCVIIILTLSNFCISLIRKIVPDAIRIPVYIVVIATLVKVLELLLHAYVPSLYNALGTFLGLIVANCIILGRAEAFASKHTPLESILDGLGMGIGYTLVIFTISLLRQLLSTGGLELINPVTQATIFNFSIIPEAYVIPIFAQPAGAFITFAAIVALGAWYQNYQSTKGATK